MKQKNFSFLEAMNMIDDTFILEASKEFYNSAIQTLSDEQTKPLNITKHPYRKSKRKLWGLAAAAVLVCAGTVIAARQGGLLQFYEKEFVSSDAQEQISSDIATIITGPEHIPSAYIEQDTLDIWNSFPELPDTSALLTIQEAMFDGTELYIYGTATENGKKYTLNADRLYINDQEYGPVSTAISGDENTDYYFYINLSELALSEPFTVTLPLSVYDASDTRYQNQELTFEVQNTSDTVTQLTSEATFEYDEFDLVIKKCSITATAINITAEYQIKNLSADTSSPVLTLLSEDGTELEFTQSTSRNVSDSLIHQEFTFTGFSEKPQKLFVGTRLVPSGEYINLCPIVYKDELEIK